LSRDKAAFAKKAFPAVLRSCIHLKWFGLLLANQAGRTAISAGVAACLKNIERYKNLNGIYISKKFVW
jgi:hypothetical protein